MDKIEENKEVSSYFHQHFILRFGELIWVQCSQKFHNCGSLYNLHQFFGHALAYFRLKSISGLCHV